MSKNKSTEENIKEMDNIFENLVQNVVNNGGSDIHIAQNGKPRLRLKNDLVSQEHIKSLNKEDTIAMYEVLKSYTAQKEGDLIDDTIEMKSHAGFAIGYNKIKSKGENIRFRVNVSTHNGGYYIVLRIIDGVPPKLEDLKFNERTYRSLVKASQSKIGLFLVVGATGSGKSTTLASIIRKMNEYRNLNIVTLEDPIEFEHKNIKSQIIQKELGRDFPRFSEGLHSALREDPDVILVGEIRDESSLNLCLKASETGHIVFATLHTNDAVSTIQRLSSMSENPKFTRDRLSQTLIGVIAQRLFVGLDKNRYAIWEILMADTGMRANIRDGQDPMIKSSLDTTPGCQSFNKTIKDYYARGIMDEALAMGYSLNPNELDLTEIEINNNSIDIKPVEEKTIINKEKEPYNKKDDLGNNEKSKRKILNW